MGDVCGAYGWRPVGVHTDHNFQNPPCMVVYGPCMVMTFDYLLYKLITSNYTD